MLQNSPSPGTLSHFRLISEVNQLAKARLGTCPVRGRIHLLFTLFFISPPPKLLICSSLTYIKPQRQLKVLPQSVPIRKVLHFCHTKIFLFGISQGSRPLIPNQVHTGIDFTRAIPAVSSLDKNPANTLILSIFISISIDFVWL